MGQCGGACQGYISVEEYKENVNKAIKFLEGNYRETIKELEEKNAGCIIRIRFRTGNGIQRFN